MVSLMLLVAAWKNKLVEKVQEQGGVPWQCNNPVNIRCLSRHTLDALSPSLHLATFDAARLSVPVCLIDLNIFWNWPSTHVQKIWFPMLNTQGLSKRYRASIIIQDSDYSYCQYIFRGRWSRLVHWVDDLSSLCILPLICSLVTLIARRFALIVAMHEGHVIQYCIQQRLSWIISYVHYMYIYCYLTWYIPSIIQDWSQAIWNSYWTAMMSW